MNHSCFLYNFGGHSDRVVMFSSFCSFAKCGLKGHEGDDLAGMLLLGMEWGMTEPMETVTSEGKMFKPLTWLFHVIYS